MGWLDYNPILARKVGLFISEIKLNTLHNPLNMNNKYSFATTIACWRRGSHYVGVSDRSSPQNMLAESHSLQSPWMTKQDVWYHWKTPLNMSFRAYA